MRHCCHNSFAVMRPSSLGAENLIFAWKSIKSSGFDILRSFLATIHKANPVLMCAWWNLYIQRVNGCCCFFVVRGVWTALVKTWEIECFLTKAVISFMSLFIAGLRAAIRMSCQSLQCTQTSRNADRTNRQKNDFRIHSDQLKDFG